MNLRIRTLAASAALASAFVGGQAFAQSYGYYVDHQENLAADKAVPGATVVNNEWRNLSSVAQNGVAGNVGYPSFFSSTSPWPSAINSQFNTGGDAAQLTKVSNGVGGAPYPAGGSLYFAGFSGDANLDGGTVRVTDSTPVAGLENVVFQVGIGEASTYDYFNRAAPLLSYTTASGSFSSIAATYSETLEKFFNGTVEMPTGTENIYINQYAYQWDLSGVTDAITSFNISFTGVQHAQVYGLTLSQSDVFSQAVNVTAVPEPETYAMMLAGLAGVVAMARRRKQKQAA